MGEKKAGHRVILCGVSRANRNYWVGHANIFVEGRDAVAERETRPIMGGVLLKAIPWALISSHEDQARRNHGQTLDDLARRGGLSPSEALAIIQNLSWPHFDEPLAECFLMRLVVELKSAEAKAA